MSDGNGPEFPSHIEQILDTDPFVHPRALVSGRTKLGAGVSIWPQATLRADQGRIEIGRGANLQENCVVHMEPGGEVRVGEYALIGHGAILHGCSVGPGALVGINSLVLDEAVIGAGSVVTAGVCIRGRKKIPPFSLVTGYGDKYKIYPGKANPVSVIEGSLQYVLTGWCFARGIESFTVAPGSQLETSIRDKARELAGKIRAEYKDKKE